MKMQAFERMGDVGVGLFGEDDTPEDKLTRKVFTYKRRAQLSREEYLRQMAISYAASAGDGEPIDWSEEVEHLNCILN